MSADPAPNPPPLRIVCLNSALTGGGTDDQCVRQAAQISRLGQRVVIAGPGARSMEPVMAALGAPFFDTGPKFSKGSFILRAARLIRSGRFQIVHGHHGRDYWPAILAARLSGTRPKIVLTRHLAKSPGSWASRHFLLGQCDALVAVSEFVARVLREGALEPGSPDPERRVRAPIRGDTAKIHVIHGGIDTARFRPLDASATRRELGLAPEDYAFAVVGGFDLPRGKGQREFLEAAAHVRARLPRARFLIIGRGSMEEQLRADIARLGLGGSARLVGQRGDMPEVMNAMDCLVHPQIGTEAFGLVVCEAHACGKPAIASALDGIPEAFTAGGYGRLVEPENVAQLADAMIAQAAQPPLDASGVTALRARVEQAFSIERSAVELLRLYRQLVGLSV